MTVRGTRRSVRYGKGSPGPSRGRVRQRRLLAAVCLGGLMALTACGGGGGGSDEPSDSGFTATAEPTPTETSAEPTPSETETSEPTEEPTETATDDTSFEDASGSDDSSSDDSGSDSGSDSGDDVSSGVPRGQWSGTAQISVDFSDPGCGETSESYELPATLIISDPVGGEENSFNLSWASDSQTPAGAFGVSSALDATDTLDGEAVSVNYWTLSEDGSGGISGDLTDPGASEALALNLLFVPKPILPCSQYMVFPYGMATGTTLEGTVSEDSASLTLSGTSLDGTRSFRVEWS